MPVTFSNIQVLFAVLLVVTAHGWAPTTRTRSTRTQLYMAWTLPAPVQRSLTANRYWYQDCGTAVDRRVVYDDGDDDDDLLQQFWWNEEDVARRGLAFARLGGLTSKEESSHDAANAENPQRLPMRMVRGIWNRIRGSPSDAQ